MRSIRPAHLVLLFTTQTISGEDHNSWRSLVWTFLQSSVTSILLGASVVLSTQFSRKLNRYVFSQVSGPYNRRQSYFSSYFNVYGFSYGKIKYSRNLAKYLTRTCIHKSTLLVRWAKGHFCQTSTGFQQTNIYPACQTAWLFDQGWELPPGYVMWFVVFTEVKN